MASKKKGKKTTTKKLSLREKRKKEEEERLKQFCDGYEDLSEAEGPCLEKRKYFLHQREKRSCLACRETFFSEHAHNRICLRCKSLSHNEHYYNEITAETKIRETKLSDIPYLGA